MFDFINRFEFEITHIGGVDMYFERTELIFDLAVAGTYGAVFAQDLQFSLNSIQT